MIGNNETTIIFLIMFLITGTFSQQPNKISSGAIIINKEGESLLSWLSTFRNKSSSSSKLFSSWNQNHPNPCQWDFIKCSTNGLFVTEITITSINLNTNFPIQFTSFAHLNTLVLSNTNLSGDIPASIGNLSSLVTLDLSFNSLAGNIPESIGNLGALESLSLNSNSLAGEIPWTISNCTRIRQLELFDNELSGKIPAEIGLLTELEVFRAGGNQGISGEIPTQISNCKGLVVLGLADTGVSGQIPRSLGELKRLETLSVYTSKLAGRIPEEIGNCSALENLFLYQNELAGEIPEELGMLKKLKRVLLWQNNLTGEIPRALGNCSSLSVIDISLNLVTGKIPESMKDLAGLEELLLSENSLSGEIPEFIGGFENLKQIELDNNRFSGEIPRSIGRLRELTLFFAWQNQLNGSIPAELANCEKLQALDLSGNFLSGPIPDSLFSLKNLSQLLLISNQLSGEISSDIGQCENLVRLRLGSNRLTGRIPPEIGALARLSFLELSENQFAGEIPAEIGNCAQLQLVDLRGNLLRGQIPLTFGSLSSLNVLDLSVNGLSGEVPLTFGSLSSLNKLIISVNSISGEIPSSLGLCQDLQLLDLSKNSISGQIPYEIGQLQGLDIVLNLSWNSISGHIPETFSNLSKLANLDLSHNRLTGSLEALTGLDNLVSLDLSFNDLSGPIPDTKLFSELPRSSFAGNQKLCLERDQCRFGNDFHRKSTKTIVVSILLSLTASALLVLVGTTSYARVCGRSGDEEQGLDWEFTPFQKVNFTVNDLLSKLSESNVVGKGCSSTVYRVETPSKQVVAVKKILRPKNEEDEARERDHFSAEVRTLGSIRHKNIVRLLGCCENGKTRLLLFDYYSNGSLANLIHENESGMFLDWDSRFKIATGAAQGLAYLHHDCIPPIVHRDVKSNNILVGPGFEAVLADFGLAKLVTSSSECSRSPKIVAGSYGYIAPEYGYSFKITEKSDVYSFGVVLLEVLTGKQPTDSRISEEEEAHIVSWVNKQVKDKKRLGLASMLDQQLIHRSGTHIQEMLQVLGIALLCVNPSPEERPTMKDVTLMLKEISHRNEDCSKMKKSAVNNDSNGIVVFNSPRAELHCSSFSKSCELTSS